MTWGNSNLQSSQVITRLKELSSQAIIIVWEGRISSRSTVSPTQCTVRVRCSTKTQEVSNTNTMEATSQQVALMAQQPSKDNLTALTTVSSNSQDQVHPKGSKTWTSKVSSKALRLWFKTDKIKEVWWLPSNRMWTSPRAAPSASKKRCAKTKIT